MAHMTSICAIGLQLTGNVAGSASQKLEAWFQSRFEISSSSYMSRNGS